MAIDLDTEFVCLLPAGGYRLAFVDKSGVIDEFPLLGFMVMKALTHDKERWVTAVFPVSAFDVHDFDSQDFVLIRPDGQVDEPESQTFGSLEEYLKYKAKDKAVDK